MNDTPATLADQAWFWLGSAGALIFYGRFYLQWLASEKEKRSVVPVGFWYMSCIGSVILLAYGVYIQSPIGTLSQSLNIVIYSRNLVHIWRERGELSKRRHHTLHAVVAVIAVAAIAFTLRTWWHEYRYTQTISEEESRRIWYWIAVGLAGNALFATRFLIQWIATERKRRSVIPVAFWYISIAAAALQGLSFGQRAEWVYTVGMVATIFIYARNLWFIHRNPEQAEQAPAGSA
ncbi:MAG: lipid-A-disaccharide synthase N-terminal domain-containing protein [Candidatus Hydrogenedentes bacterium]|nr:lipid-A-disaccharide synthase N-terminal domain-containing protein [Candidatus Hydrogenedentota bacterium]